MIRKIQTRETCEPSVDDLIYFQGGEEMRHMDKALQSFIYGGFVASKRQDTQSIMVKQ